MTKHGDDGTAAQDDEDDEADPDRPGDELDDEYDDEYDDALDDEFDEEAALRQRGRLRNADAEALIPPADSDRRAAARRRRAQLSRGRKAQA